MAKFVVVKEAPTELNKGDFVIDKPEFLAEINSQRAKAGRNGLTGTNHLRMILDAIAQNYDPERMTQFSARVNLFEGRPFSTDKELNDIVNEMLRSDYPAVYSKYLEKKIKSRPKDTTTVYYVDSNIKSAHELFIQNGLDELVEEKPVKEKSGKVVGKPAVTNQQALNIASATKEQSKMEVNNSDQ
jgi:acyl-CoA hydrolase